MYILYNIASVILTNTDLVLDEAKNDYEGIASSKKFGGIKTLKNGFHPGMDRI